MARQGKKRMTLSEHLALRAQAAEEERAQEETRRQTIRHFRELDAQALCNCPACVRLRQMKRGSEPRGQRD